MSQVVVIGGSGFIGSRLVHLLRQDGNDVRIVDRERSEAFPEITTICEVRDSESLETACAGAEVLINLSAEHRDDVQPVSLYDEVNVGGAESVCRVADAIGCHQIVFTSSVAVYGFSESEADESAPKNPFNDYGRTKLEAEAVYQKWADQAPDRSLVVVRPTVVFGEGNRGNVYNLLRQIARGPFLMIGDGTNRKSMAYVDNVAGFLKFSLGFGAGTHIYNYVDKPDYDMNALVAATKSQLGKSPEVGLRIPTSIGLLLGRLLDGVAAVLRRSMPLSHVRVQKFVSSSVFSSARMRASGYEPVVPLPEAVSRTIKHEFGSEQR